MYHSIKKYILNEHNEGKRQVVIGIPLSNGNATGLSSLKNILKKEGFTVYLSRNFNSATLKIQW